MGQLTLFAQQDNTHVSVINLTDGAEYVAFDIATAGQRWERISGVPNYIEVRSDKPISIFSGKALADRNDWASVLTSDNNAEFGRVFHGFTERFVWVVVPRGGPTEVRVDNRSSGQLTILRSEHASFSDDSVEIFHMDGFSNDDLIITSSRDCMVEVGSSSIKDSTGWAFTPPSVTAGEDGRELGTHFYFYAHPELTIWPFSDDTEVTIRRLGVGTEATVSLGAGDFWCSRDLAGLTGERNLVRTPEFVYGGGYVEVIATRPVLVNVGPANVSAGGFTLDFAPTVPTGPDRHESFVNAEKTGIVLLSFDNQTTVNLRTVSGAADHDVTVQPADWRGVGPYYRNWHRSLCFANERTRS